MNQDEKTTAPRTVLVVEDEPDVSTYVSAVLSDAGYKVLVAADGAEGLRLLKSRRPELVTLDINLPEKTGVKFYRELREDVETAGTPVVMVTGVQKEFKDFIHHRRKVLPPEGYVAKPFTAEQLLTAVERALSSTPGRPASE